MALTFANSQAMDPAGKGYGGYGGYGGGGGFDSGPRGGHGAAQECYGRFSQEFKQV